MISRQQINHDARVCLGLARFIAPKDTGNLAYNAIESHPMHFGFRIKYSLAAAHYIYFLEEGTRVSTTHVGFIANETVPTLSAYLYAAHATQNKRMQSAFKHAAKIGEQDVSIGDTQARQERHRYNLGLDVEAIAQKNNWKHNPRIENPQSIKKISAYYGRFY